MNSTTNCNHPHCQQPTQYVVLYGCINNHISGELYLCHNHRHWISPGSLCNTCDTRIETLTQEIMHCHQGHLIPITRNLLCTQCIREAIDIVHKNNR